MQQDGPYVEDLRQLHELAVYSRNVAAPLLETLPSTREGQQKLADLLEASITAAGIDFKISKEFLVREVMLKDKDLYGSWGASPRQLAWLMVHEEMSNYFVQYAINHWNPETFLVHHIPKSAGSSVNQLLDQQRFFVAFPQTTFETMCASNGLLGFANQVEMFGHVYRTDRIYIGGHYNLPDQIRKLKLFGRCQGVTLCRPPVTIMSSAVRSLWTRIEHGEAGLAQLYGIGGIDGAELKRQRQTLNSTGRAEPRVTDLLIAIMDSSAFRAEFDEIYVKYFYNHEIGTIADLSDYLADCGTIFPWLDPRGDLTLALKNLKVDGFLPRTNTSILSEKNLFDAIGGSETFAAMVKPRMLESSRIYDTLVSLRAT